MPSIIVGIPCYDGSVSMECMVSMLGLQRDLGRAGINFALEMTGSASLIPIARNYIVARFLERPGFTHLLFVDADIGFDPAAVTRYLRADKDIVAGIYPIKHLDIGAIRKLPADGSVAATLKYATRLITGEQPTADGFVRAEYAATGFMLIRRSAIERMIASYPDLKYRHSFAFAGPGAPSENLYALFDTSLDRQRGLYLPEDYTFCERWRALGGEIWVDVRSKFSHVGRHVFAGDFSLSPAAPVREN